MDDLKAKARKTVAFMAEDSGVPVDLSRPFYVKRDPEPPAPVAPPVQTVQAASPVAGKQPASDDGWTTKKAKPRKPKGQVHPLILGDFVKLIFDDCITAMERSFCYAGPSLRLSEVDGRFTTNSFTYPRLIGALRDEIVRRGKPSLFFGVKDSARFAAASSPGKGRNFNFKVQEQSKGQWGAVAQIHVLWE